MRTRSSLKYAFHGSSFVIIAENESSLLVYLVHAIVTFNCDLVDVMDVLWDDKFCYVFPRQQSWQSGNMVELQISAFLPLVTS